jgi:hypothetical protein
VTHVVEHHEVRPAQLGGALAALSPISVSARPWITRNGSRVSRSSARSPLHDRAHLAARALGWELGRTTLLPVPALPPRRSSRAAEDLRADDGCFDGFSAVERRWRIKAAIASGATWP